MAAVSRFSGPNASSDRAHDLPARCLFSGIRAELLQAAREDQMNLLDLKKQIERELRLWLNRAQNYARTPWQKEFSARASFMPEREYCF